MFTKSLLVIALSCGLALVPRSALGQQTNLPNGPNAEQEVIRLTQEYAAASSRGDADALNRIFADDFTFAHSGGRVDPKSVYVNTIRTGSRRYETFHLENVQVRLYGTTALATGRIHIKVVNNNNPANDFLAQYTFVWARQQGWKMVALQLTRIADPPAAPGAAPSAAPNLGR